MFLRGQSGRMNSVMVSSRGQAPCFTVASVMIENSKSEIRQLLPMSFLSKSWGPSFDLVGHCLSPVSLGDFLRRKAFSRNPEMAVNESNPLDLVGRDLVCCKLGCRQLFRRSDRLNRKPTNKARIGIFGVGLEAYWDQFAGLKPKLEGFQRHVETQLEQGAARSSARTWWTAIKAPKVRATCSPAVTWIC